MADQTENITVVYDSENNSADAEAVAKSVLALKALVDEIQEGIEDNKRILIKARPFSEGSLEIPLALIALGGAMLISEYPVFEYIRRVLAQFFKIKIALQGKSIEVQEGNVIVLNDSKVTVDSITLNCLDSNSDVSKYLSDVFESVSRDASIKSVRFESENTSEVIAVVQRDEFAYMQSGYADEIQINRERPVQSREVVTIRQPSFDFDLAWRFIWQGVKITAKVSDLDYFERISSGIEKFVAGDSLEVELLRNQEYSAASKDFVNKSYEIIKVYTHMTRPEQGELFDE